MWKGLPLGLRQARIDWMILCVLCEQLKQSHRQQQQQLTLQMTMEDWVIYLYEIRVLRHEREGEFSLLDARKIFFRSKLLVEDEQV